MELKKRLLGMNFELQKGTKPTQSRAGNLILNVKFGTSYSSNLLDFTEKLISERSKIDGIMISLATPPKHSFQPVFDLWKRAEVLVRYDLTKSGIYILYVNDGTEALKEDERKFQDSCTRIMVQDPQGLSMCRLPSIVNLRRIARGTHFVTMSGNMMKFPKRFTNRSYSTVQGSVDKDVVSNDENERLIEFLGKSGVDDEA